MTRKRDYHEIQERKALQARGYEIDGKRCIRMHTNPQDETLKHLIAKAVTAHVCANVGYFVDSEVSFGSRQIDVLAYGHEHRKPLVVELETNLTDEKRQANLKNYYTDSLKDVYSLDVSELPDDIQHMSHSISEQLGL